MLRIASAAAAALAFVATTTLAVDECGQYTSCETCVPNNFCGWCSPGAIVYKNGTGGRRCGDMRDDPWDCPGKYQTTTCEEGFTCDTSAEKPTCESAGKGEGVPKEQCDAGCKKAAKVFVCDRQKYECTEAEPGHENDGAKEACDDSCQPQYTCNHETHTCEEAREKKPGMLPKDECDQACAAPFKTYKCVDGTFTCEEAPAAEGGVPQAICQEQCVPPKPIPATPEFLRGLWRGVQINKGYAQGEWDFDFSEVSVTVTQPDKTKWEADVLEYKNPAAAGAGNPAEVWLAFKAGAFAGKMMKGKFDETAAGGQAPETENVFLGFGKAGSSEAATAPDSADEAMAGNGFQAYVLSKCKDGLPNCKFEPSSLWARLSEQLADAANMTATRRLAGADACNAHGSCTECVGDPHCGWCSVPVIYADGSPGSQCAGYDASGKPDPLWTCPAMYKRTDCGDYLCDQSTFQCREAQPGEVGTLTQDECQADCHPKNQMYVCNQETFTCEEVPDGTAGGVINEVCNEMCVKPPPPPPPKAKVKCNNETLTCESGCHVGEEGCIDEDVCAEQCHKAPPPSKADPITPVAIRGVWRGIGIHNGYKFGEWDVKITNDTAVFKNSQSQVWHAKVTTGGGVPMTLTPTDGENSGKDIPCLYTQQTGPETTRMTLAMGKPGSATAPADYDTAMTKEVGMAELYLVKCKGEGEDAAGGSLCDFSSSTPH